MIPTARHGLFFFFASRQPSGLRLRAPAENDVYDVSVLACRSPRVAGVVHARGGQENRVAVPVLPGRAAGGVDADVQRSAVSAPVERQRLPAVFAELRHRAAGARGQLHPRGDGGQHGHCAAQHVPAKGAHRPQAVQHNRLSHGMADFRMVKGT